MYNPVYKLVKINSKQWAIYDTVTRVFYYGKKRDLLKRIQELNQKENK